MQRRLDEKDRRQSGFYPYGLQDDGVARGPPGQERLSRWQMRDRSALAAQQTNAAADARAFLHPPAGLASSPFSAALGSPFGGAPGLAQGLPRSEVAPEIDQPQGRTAPALGLNLGGVPNLYQFVRPLGTDPGGTRRGGASEGPYAAEGVGNQWASIAADLHSMAKAHAPAEKPRGTLAGLGHIEDACMYLNRGCGTFQVSICDGHVGKQFVQALLDTAAGAAGVLHNAGWPCLPTLRMAIGLAGCYHGGKTHVQAEGHRLTASDWLSTSMEGWDDYTAPTCDGKPEKRPNFPITFDDWVKRTRRRNTIYALVYGREHLKTRERALLSSRKCMKSTRTSSD